MRCHFKNEDAGRTTLFTFNFQGGGFNQVYARDEDDAFEVAVQSFESDDRSSKLNLRVLRGTIREVKDVQAYYNSFPLMD